MAKKVSELTALDVAKYIRLDEMSADDEAQIETFLDVAKNYISSYTGVPQISNNTDDDTLDSYPDFVIAALVLCQDMYDNRTLYTDKNNVNKTVETILNMHTRICL